MRAEGIPATWESIQVTAGSQMALDVVTKVLCEQGDTVLVEDPTFTGALGVFGGAGLRVEHVPTDAHGLIPAALAEMLQGLRAAGRRPRMLYIIPNCQNPLGVTLDPRRRGEVVERCRAAGVAIVEDNPYGMLTFDEQPPGPSFLELDPDNVIYLGSFSKIFSPGIRVGWVAAPSWMRRALLLACEATVICPPMLSQFLAAEFVAEHDFQRIVRSAARIYRKRHDTLREALFPHLPEGTTMTVPSGGFFTWVTLPEGWATAPLLDVALEEGVVFVPGMSFRQPGSGHRELRLAYSSERPSRLVEGARRIASAFDRLTDARAAAAPAPSGDCLL